MSKDRGKEMSVHPFRIGYENSFKPINRTQSINSISQEEIFWNDNEKELKQFITPETPYLQVNNSDIDVNTHNGTSKLTLDETKQMIA